VNEKCQTNCWVLPGIARLRRQYNERLNMVQMITLLPQAQTHKPRSGLLAQRQLRPGTAAVLHTAGVTQTACRRSAGASPQLVQGLTQLRALACGGCGCRSTHRPAPYRAARPWPGAGTAVPAQCRDAGPEGPGARATQRPPGSRRPRRAPAAAGPDPGGTAGRGSPARALTRPPPGSRRPRPRSARGTRRPRRPRPPRCWRR